MTPEAMSLILENTVINLADIMSFGLGGLVGIAFVISSKMEWF